MGRKEWSITVINSESEGAGETTRGPGQALTACGFCTGQGRGAAVQAEAGCQLRLLQFCLGAARYNAFSFLVLTRH